MPKKTFTLTLEISVEADRPYLEWLEQSLKSSFKIRDLVMRTDSDYSIFRPSYNPFADDDSYDIDENAPYWAWCNGVEIDITVHNETLARQNSRRGKKTSG